jgi:hypothetical protein
MTLGEADGVGAGAGVDGAEGDAALVLGAGPAAGWVEELAQPAARMARPAARAVSAFSPGPGHRLPVIGRLRCRIPGPGFPGPGFTALPSRPITMDPACRGQRTGRPAIMYLARQPRPIGAVLKIAEVLPPPAADNLS